jgi:hypothetical protein
VPNGSTQRPGGGESGEAQSQNTASSPSTSPV